MLPRTREKPASTVAAADYGTLVHHWKETGDWCPDWADIVDCNLLARKIAATRIDRNRWWPGTGEHEVTFAVDVFAAIGMGQLHVWRGPREGADAWKKQFDPRRFLTGTIDYVAPGWIDDLKTGRWPVKSDTSQLISYALYSWLNWGAATDWSTARSITQWPKYPIDAPPVRRWGQPLTALDMVCHLDDLKHAMTHEYTNPTEEGCRFCDSRPSCPEWSRSDSASLRSIDG